MLTALLEENYTVIAATRRNISSLSSDVLDPRIEWVSSKKAASAIGLLKPHAVIHLATDYGHESQLHETILANEVWPLRLLEAAIRAGTEIFLNTDSFFSKPTFTYPHMRSYTLSKSNFIAWAKLAVSEAKTQFITLRLEHVFGEKDNPNKFVPSILRKMQCGEIVEATIGTQYRDFIYVADVVRAFTTVLRSYGLVESEMTVIEVGTGQPITVRSFIETANRLCGSLSPLQFGNIQMRQDEIMSSYADTSTMNKLGWIPEFGLEDALRRCITTSSDFKDKNPSSIQR